MHMFEIIHKGIRFFVWKKKTKSTRITRKSPEKQPKSTRKSPETKEIPWKNPKKSTTHHAPDGLRPETELRGLSPKDPRSRWPVRAVGFVWFHVFCVASIFLELYYMSNNMSNNMCTVFFLCFCLLRVTKLRTGQLVQKTFSILIGRILIQAWDSFGENKQGLTWDPQWATSLEPRSLVSASDLMMRNLRTEAGYCCSTKKG